MQVPERIETTRLVLRRHRETDLAAFASFLADPNATRFMAFTEEQKSLDGARGMLDFVIGAYPSAEPVFSLTIADPRTDEYLGSCGLQRLSDEDGYEIYFTVLPEHQNRGLGTEATRGLIDYILDTTGINRLIAFVIPANVPSIRVAEKLGFIDDGPVSRQASTGSITHAELEGRRYVLTRETAMLARPRTGNVPAN